MGDRPSVIAVFGGEPVAPDAVGWVGLLLGVGGFVLAAAVLVGVALGLSGLVVFGFAMVQRVGDEWAIATGCTCRV